MTDELIATIRDTPEVLDYIDIPIQHCSGRVLASMGRHGSADQLRELFSRLRREIPGMVLRTTGMAGFPGETDDEADELASFIQEEEFDYCSVFAYSQEEGTAAAEMPDRFPMTSSSSVRSDSSTSPRSSASPRPHDMSASGSALSSTGRRSRRTAVELIGHAWFQAPDSDGAVHIRAARRPSETSSPVTSSTRFCYEMIGEIVGRRRKGSLGQHA